MTARWLTKQQMTEKLLQVQQIGWIKNQRPLNTGGIGNTIDSLLGLSENNLPIADTAQWELKTRRIGSQSLLTLFHMEPEPRAERIVVNLLLPKYGWPDQAGRLNELSFRQTLRATVATDRGFRITVDRATERLLVVFESREVQLHHSAWLQGVSGRIGLGPLNPQPFWKFQDLFLKASTKMLNSFFVEVETERIKGEEFFRVQRILVLQGFELDRFLNAIETGAALVDFDARTHHNHGTKFRLRQDSLPGLYRYVEQASSLLEG